MLKVQFSNVFHLNRVLVFWMTFGFLAILSCTTDRTENTEDYDIDTDGDGIVDAQEELNGTDKNDSCDPVHDTSYISYDSLNLQWSDADCDGDGLNNGAELVAESNPYGDPVIKDLAVPEFLPNLSQLKLFKGDLKDFQYNTNVHEYEMITPLFTDYAHKLRIVAIPDGEQMTYDGGGLLLFPDNTILAKTFYYLIDERDPALGKKIIETRVLIKKSGEWLVRNYFWNEAQTDAVLDDDLHALQVDWIDSSGTPKTVDYKVPSNNQCVQCHEISSTIVPIGPKARVINFVHNGKNQLQYFIDLGLLSGAPNVSEIPALPDWSNTALAIEDRARAYLDVNCAHCHQPGGSYNVDFGDNFQFTYETSFEDSHIYDERVQIVGRMNTQISGYFMPLIGTSLLHDEGVDLINDYIASLDD